MKFSAQKFGTGPQSFPRALRWALLSVVLGSLACRGESEVAHAHPPKSGKGAPSETPRKPEAKPPEPPAAASTQARELSWRFSGHPSGVEQVRVYIPAHAAGQRFPTLIALHGRGESLKGAERGSEGWLLDYALREQLARLQHPPLTRDDFRGLIQADALERINRSLVKEPYRGLVLVFPYVPDRFRGESGWGEAARVAHFFAHTLWPKLREEAPVDGNLAIDGVSLGARLSWMVGCAQPELFRVVSGTQMALIEAEVPYFVERSLRARKRNAKLLFRVVSSDADVFQPVSKALSEALRAASIPHEQRRLRGAHGYRFNRGPGGLEMLLYHDRKLRGLAIISQ